MHEARSRRSLAFRAFQSGPRPPCLRCVAGRAVEDAHGGMLQDTSQLAGIQTEALGHVYLDVDRHSP